MAADQERADRIRLLKQENPQLKWRHIADHVGVELRSAQMWQETGAISYDNAKRLAQLIADPERNVDWIMRGPREDQRAPSPFTDDGADARLTRMEQRLEAHAQAVEALIAQQNQLLARQSDILDRIEEAVRRDDEVRDEIADLIQTRGREIVEGRPPTTETSPQPGRPRPAGAKTPRATKQRTR